MENLAAGQDARAGAIAEWFNQDTVAVVIVEDKDVIVAAVGCDNKPACLVRMDLSRGRLSDGGETVMSANVG